MDPFGEPLFSSDILKEKIVDPVEGQMRLAAGKGEGRPVKEKAAGILVVKEEVDDGENWGNGGCSKGGNPDLGENTEGKKRKCPPGTEASGDVTHKELSPEIKKEVKPFSGVESGVKSASDQTEYSLPYAKHVSFNAHVLFSNEYEKAVKREVEDKEGQNVTEERKNCPVDGCSEDFLSCADLVDHMKTHPKPLICGLCKKSFTAPWCLRRHYTTHTGEKQFPCSFCDKRFADSSSSKRHIRTHTGERPYECDLCEYKTSDASSLKRHRLTHRGEEKKRRTKEKTFPCSDCEYKGSDCSALKRHRFTHSGEKPFSCSGCDYKTADKSHLIRHRKRFNH